MLLLTYRFHFTAWSQDKKPRSLLITILISYCPTSMVGIFDIRHKSKEEKNPYPSFCTVVFVDWLDRSLFTMAHWVILEHYYSMDFTWWFDRKISFFSIISKTAEKFVNWQQFKAALFGLTEKKLLPSNKTFKLMWRSNAWMDPLEKNTLLYQFLLYFLQVKSFPPWMASIGHNIDKFWFVFWNKV